MVGTAWQYDQYLATRGRGLGNLTNPRSDCNTAYSNGYGYTSMAVKVSTLPPGTRFRHPFEMTAMLFLPNESHEDALHYKSLTRCK